MPSILRFRDVSTVGRQSVSVRHWGMDSSKTAWTGRILSRGARRAATVVEDGSCHLARRISCGSPLVMGATETAKWLTIAGYHRHRQCVCSRNTCVDCHAAFDTVVFHVAELSA